MSYHVDYTLFQEIYMRRFARFGIICSTPPWVFFTPNCAKYDNVVLKVFSK